MIRDRSRPRWYYSDCTWCCGGSRCSLVEPVLGVLEQCLQSGLPRLNSQDQLFRPSLSLWCKQWREKDRLPNTLGYLLSHYFGTHHSGRPWHDRNRMMRDRSRSRWYCSDCTWCCEGSRCWLVEPGWGFLEQLLLSGWPRLCLRDPLFRPSLSQWCKQWREKDR